jgi:hypothetical protein
MDRSIGQRLANATVLLEALEALRHAVTPEEEAAAQHLIDVECALQHAAHLEAIREEIRTDWAFRRITGHDPVLNACTSYSAGKEQ